MNLLDYLFDVGANDLPEPGLPLDSRSDLSLWSNRPKQNDNDQIEPLVRRVGQLNLAVAALVRLCVKQGLVKPAELSTLMREIDLEDGHADGQLLEKKPPTPEWCPKCEAKTAAGKSYCMFCGERFEKKEVG